MVISICNEKGGSGKTTIAVNLAVKCAIEEVDTLLIDSDPQRSVEVFTNQRAKNNLNVLFDTSSKLGRGLGAEIQKLTSKYDAIIVDTGGRDSLELRESLLRSNLVIIPVVSSLYDIKVLDKMLDIASEAQINNPKLKILIVISKAPTNPFLAKNIEALTTHIKEKNLDNIKLANSVIFEREAYKKALLNGKGVIEFCNKEDKAYLDFNNLTKEIMEYINE